MAKAKPKANDLPPPSDKERAVIERATARHAERRAASTAIGPPKIKADIRDNALFIGPDHNDAAGWSAQLLEALGTDCPIMGDMLLRTAGDAHGSVVATQASADSYAKRSRETLAFVSAIEPKGALEATLALQMMAAHEAATLMSKRLHDTKDRNAMNDYARLMNQSMRTFTAQVEALSKLRTGGKQQVEVRYVYVDARTQTVVNGGQGGAGGAGEPALQSHAPAGALGYAPAPGVPVWSEDPTGHVLPFASGKGQAAVSDARGDKPRRSARQG